mgnify:CR=1 FL=1
MISFLEAFGLILLVAVLAGSATGLLGVFVVGLRVPFLAVCIAHCALAAAVFGKLAELPPQLSGFAGACVGGLALGWFLHKRNLEPNAAIGTLFSLTMGLAFIGIGLQQGAKSGTLGLLWGSVLFVTWEHAIFMAIILSVIIAFLIVFCKELKLLLFSRELAAALTREALVYTGLLVLISGVIAVNIDIVGGLLIYSLICNPAVAALCISRSFRGSLAWSCAFGIVSATGGFMVAYWFDFPVGACIVLVSGAIAGIAAFAGSSTTGLQSQHAM